MRNFFVFCLALGTGCFLVAQTTTTTITPSTSSDSRALSGVSTNDQTEIQSDNGGEVLL